MGIRTIESHRLFQIPLRFAVIFLSPGAQCLGQLRFGHRVGLMLAHAEFRLSHQFDGRQDQEKDE